MFIRFILRGEKKSSNVRMQSSVLKYDRKKIYHWILLVVTLYFNFCTSEWTNTYCQLIQMRYIHFLVTNSILFLLLFHIRYVCAFWLDLYTNSVIMYFGTQYYCLPHMHPPCKYDKRLICLSANRLIQNRYVWWNGNAMYGTRYKQTHLYHFDERYRYIHECVEFIANNVNVCIWKIYCVFTWIYTFRIDSGLMIYLDSFCSFLFWNIEMASCQEYSSSLSCFRQVFSSFQSVNVKSHQVFSTKESNHY